MINQMSLGIKYKDNRHVLEENTDYVPYLEYPMLKDTGIVRHGFSTRLGGVSEGYYASMNLSFDRETGRKQWRRTSGESGKHSVSAARIWSSPGRRIQRMCGS